MPAWQEQVLKRAQARNPWITDLAGVNGKSIDVVLPTKIPHFLGYNPPAYLVHAHATGIRLFAAYHQIARACGLEAYTTERNLRASLPPTTHQDDSTTFMNQVKDYLEQRTNSGTTDLTSCENGLAPHQATVGHLLAADSPVQRLLVHHRVGSGKTRSMAHVLSNYPTDARTRIVVCPSEPSCQQVWKELADMKDHSFFAPHMTYENHLDQHADSFVQVVRRDFPFHCTFATNTRGPLLILTLDYLDQLLTQMRTRPEVPIRGTSLLLRGMGSTENPLSNKILLLDECHLICEPLTVARRLLHLNDGSTQHVFHQQYDLTPLRHQLRTMHGTIFGAFTATLPETDLKRTWLVEIMTMGQQQTLTGYVHRIQDANKGGAFQHVSRDAIPIPTLVNDNRAHGLCTLRGSEFEPEFRHTTCATTILESLDVRTRIVNNLADYAPKIHAMMEDLRKHQHDPNGSLILADETSGMYLVNSVLRDKGSCFIMISHNRSIHYNPLTQTETPLSESAAIALWNNPPQNPPITTVLYDIDYLAESINILGIGTVYGIADFKSQLKMTQAFGRADRMCTRDKLRERTNNLRMIHYMFNDDPFAPAWMAATEEMVLGQSF